MQIYWLILFFHVILFFQLTPVANRVSSPRSRSIRFQLLPRAILRVNCRPQCLAEEAAAAAAKSSIVYFFFFFAAQKQMNKNTKMKISNYSGSSRKRTPLGREKGVRNRSWPLTRTVLVNVVRDRWSLTGAFPADNKHWECKIKFHRIKLLLSAMP